MSDLNQVMKPESPMSIERQTLEGILKVQNGKHYIKVDSETSLSGPLEGVVEPIPDIDSQVAVARSQNGRLWLISPSGGGAGGAEILSGIWRWTTKTADANSNGQVGVNIGDWATATQVNINEQTDGNVDVTSVLGLIKAGDVIRLQHKTDSSRFVRYTVGAIATDHGTWWSFPVVVTASGGTVPNGNTEMLVTFIRPGGGGGGSGGGLVYTEIVGNGVNMGFYVVHNFGTKAVLVAVYRTVAPYDEIVPEIRHDTTNQIRVVFSSPPAIGEFTVVIAGPSATLVPPGPGAGDKTYVHDQSAPNSIWNVVHNLNKFPAVDVVDGGGSLVIPNVSYVDSNNVQLTFGSSTSGKAFVN